MAHGLQHGWCQAGTFAVVIVGGIVEFDLLAELRVLVFEVKVIECLRLSLGGLAGVFSHPEGTELAELQLFPLDNLWLALL